MFEFRALRLLGGKAVCASESAALAGKRWMHVALIGAGGVDSLSNKRSGQLPVKASVVFHAFLVGLNNIEVVSLSSESIKNVVAWP